MQQLFARLFVPSPVWLTLSTALPPRHGILSRPGSNDSSIGGEMKKVILISAAFLLATGSAFADHHLKGEGGMKMMDTNKDGMISKDEFMKHHEMMWDKMKKNSAGSVDMKDMEMMHKEMAGMHKEMMKEEKKK
jgi:hypothetical protein